MNPNPPARQNSEVFIFMGANAGEIDTKREQYSDNRVHFRKWHLPDYVKGEHFESWLVKMWLLFKDAKLSDVANGTALPIPHGANDTAITIARRAIYMECDSQIYSFIYRTLTIENGGITDSSGIPQDLGHTLLKKLLEINYGTTEDNIPTLKSDFLNPQKSRQGPDMSIDQWAKKIRTDSAVLTSNGHPMSEREKSMVFRKGLLDAKARDVLIIPSRTESFEDLLKTAKAYFENKADSSLSSDKIFLATPSTSPSCPYCLKYRNKSFPHSESACRFKQQQEAQPGEKRTTEEPDISYITCHCCGGRGHYAYNCPSLSSGGRGSFGRGRGDFGHGGRGFNTSRGRGAGGSYQLTWIPEESENPAQIAAAAPNQRVNAVAAANAANSFMLDSNFAPFFGNMVTDYSVFKNYPGLSQFKWIYDTGCNTHCTFHKPMLSNYSAYRAVMNAANGSEIIINGEGDCQNIHRVKHSDDLHVSLFSQRQAMSEGARITLSPDGHIFTVNTASPNSCTLHFIYDGQFWIWEDREAMEAVNVVLTDNSTMTVSSSSSPSFSSPSTDISKPMPVMDRAPHGVISKPMPVMDRAPHGVISKPMPVMDRAPHGVTTKPMPVMDRAPHGVMTKTMPSKDRPLYGGTNSSPKTYFVLPSFSPSSSLMLFTHMFTVMPVCLRRNGISKWNLLDSMWIYTFKYNQNGIIVRRYRTRILKHEKKEDCEGSDVIIKRQ
jgi:hypothetical protein